MCSNLHVYLFTAISSVYLVHYTLKPLEGESESEKSLLALNHITFADFAPFYSTMCINSPASLFIMKCKCVHAFNYPIIRQWHDAENHSDTGQELHSTFTSNISIGKHVGAIRAGLSISQTADLL